MTLYVLESQLGAGNPQPTATHSHPPNSMENGTSCWKVVGVTVGGCGSRVAADILSRARAYAAATPVAISGSNGHGQTFALACSLTNGFALDEAEALELLREWNTDCMPPWTERELRHKIAESLKVSHSKPRGHLLGRDGAHFSPPPVAASLRTEKSVWKIERRARESVATSKEPSEIRIDPKEPEPAVDWPPLVQVPGCEVGRPPEIEMADDDWRALEASGFVNEPCVQLAAATFGPCRVVEAGRGHP